MGTSAKIVSRRRTPRLDELVLMGSLASVNFIINTCQNLGSGIIQDPGPPPAGYTCPMSSVGEPSNPCPKPFMMTDARGPVSSNTNSLATPTPDFITITSSTSIVTGHLTQTTTSTMQTTGAMSNSSHYEEDGHAVLPTGAKAAIGAASGIAFLAILAFAICLLRRRTRSRDTTIEITHQDVQEASPPTPLLPPLGSAHGAIHAPPLTPPPRLQERRLLPVSPSPSRPSIIITTPKAPLGAVVAQGGPLSKSSVSSLTSSRHSPGFDRSTKPYYRVPPPGDLAGGPQAGKTASMSSATSGRTATTVSSISSSFPALAPLSPTRPVRPCDKLLRIPDLVCPGPPPNRSLPSPPSRSPSGPAALSRDQQQHTESRSSGERVPPRQAAPGVIPREEPKHVYISTKTSTRESLERDSWGSWGARGGGAGIGVSSAQNEDGRMDSPVLEGADLERIGGRY
ncbi:hypothetical protein CGRA01v4_01257 [Colletotrichum graminicola]|nr:hypothetical protein CGRA01v4_01257 [Colletotrichum graminicola]